MKPFIFIVIFSLIVFQGCKKPEGPSDQNLFNTYDRKALLSNLGNQIINEYENTLQSAIQLENSVNQFHQNTNLSYLQNLKNQYLNLLLQWKKAEFSNFGPQEENFIGQNIDFGNFNQNLFQQNLANVNLDSTYFAEAGVTVKGLGCIEFLLFSQNENQILDLFTTDSFANRRKNYLLGCVKEIQYQLIKLIQLWKPNGGNYLQTFVSKDGRDVTSSLTVYCNSLVYFMENVRRSKIGQPSGIENQGNINLNLLEKRLSQQSIHCIKANLEGLQNAFTGKNGQGLDDLLNHLKIDYNGTLLSDVIKNKFNEVQSKIANIQNLENAIQNDFQKVQELHTSLKQLVVLLKVDMMSNLGLLVTYTDNDGD